MNLQQAHKEHAARQAELDTIRANWSRHMKAYAEWVDEVSRREEERYERRKRERREEQRNG